MMTWRPPGDAGWLRLLPLKVCVSEEASYFPQMSRAHCASGNADPNRQESDGIWCRLLGGRVNWNC